MIPHLIRLSFRKNWNDTCTDWFGWQTEDDCLAKKKVLVDMMSTNTSQIDRVGWDGLNYIEIRNATGNAHDFFTDDRFVTGWISFRKITSDPCDPKAFEASALGARIRDTAHDMIAMQRITLMKHFSDAGKGKISQEIKERIRIAFDQNIEELSQIIDNIAYGAAKQ